MQVYIVSHINPEVISKYLDDRSVWYKIQDGPTPRLVLSHPTAKDILLLVSDFDCQVTESFGKIESEVDEGSSFTYEGRIFQIYIS